MLSLPKPVIFEWDKGNSDKNWVKHKVSNKEAEEVFQNEPKFIFKDETHSQIEERYGLFGITNQGRKLSIVFTIRGNQVRVITARDISKRERRIYEEKVQKNT